MKKRHICKVNIFPKKEKEMLKFLNDPRAFEKLSKLGGIADKMNAVKDSIEQNKFNDLEGWGAFSLTNMSPFLFETTKNNGFQEKFQKLILEFTTQDETKNEDAIDSSREG